MSKKRDKVRARRRTRWENEKRGLLDEARKRIGLGPDEKIADAVLLREVDLYLPVTKRSGHEMDHRLDPREQWFGHRLMGLAATHAECGALAVKVKDFGSNLAPIGLGNSPRTSRRSPAAGRRRNRARRERLQSQ